MALKQTVDNVPGGVNVSIPGAPAFRIVPASGQAEFPRLVKLGTGQVLTVWGPEWQPAPTGGSILIPVMALPFSSPAAAKANNNELWTVETCDDLCVVPQSIDPRPARQTLYAGPAGTSYNQNDFTPIFDMRPWRSLMFDWWVNSSPSVGGQFLAYGWDEAGNIDFNQSTGVNASANNTRACLLVDSDGGNASTYAGINHSGAQNSYVTFPRYVAFKFNSAFTTTGSFEVIGIRR